MDNGLFNTDVKATSKVVNKSKDTAKWHDRRNVWKITGTLDSQWSIYLFYGKSESTTNICFKEKVYF